MHFLKPLDAELRESRTAWLAFGSLYLAWRANEQAGTNVAHKWMSKLMLQEALKCSFDIVKSLLENLDDTFERETAFWTAPVH